MNMYKKRVLAALRRQMNKFQIGARVVNSNGAPRRVTARRIVQVRDRFELAICTCAEFDWQRGRFSASHAPRLADKFKVAK